MQQYSVLYVEFKIEKKKDENNLLYQAGMHRGWKGIFNYFSF